MKHGIGGNRDGVICLRIDVKDSSLSGGKFALAGLVYVAIGQVSTYRRMSSSNLTPVLSNNRTRYVNRYLPSYGRRPNDDAKASDVRVGASSTVSSRLTPPTQQHL